MNSLIYLGCPTSDRPEAEKLLKSLGVAARWADDAAQAVRSLDERESLVLADFAGADTARLVQEIRERRPGTFFVAISDATRAAATAEIERAGLPIVLHRPLDARLLSVFFPGANGNGNGGNGSAPAHRKARPAIVAESPAMRRAVAALAQASATRAGVLVCGEAGSGRHMVAREIHDRSQSTAGEFVYVDCSEVSAEALQARIFGTAEDEGAGGGGERRSAERVSAASALMEAQGGTLYLAHVADAPSRLQARLARVLRDGEVIVGESRRALPLDVRPIASSDPSWDTAVAEGRIRADLSKRIALARVDVPPLRSRREDIPQLAASLLQRACDRHRVPVKAIDPSALALLAALPWRGNAREMADLLDSLVLRAAGGSIRIEDVLAAVRLDTMTLPFVPAGTLRDARRRFERDYITAVLEQHRGRIGEAAHALGIQRTNLYRKMRTLKVSWRGNGNGHGV